MLDIRRIRESTDLVRQGLAAKSADEGLDRLLELDERRRRKVSEVEALKQERNTASKEIGGGQTARRGYRERPGGGARDR